MNLELSADWTDCYQTISAAMGSATAEKMQQDRLSRRSNDATAKNVKKIERKNEIAEETNGPHWGKTKNVPYALFEGALVCPDFKTVRFMFQVLVHQRAEVLQDRVTKGRFRSLTGPPSREPDLEFYGCGIIPPGTRVLVEEESIVTIISANVNGKLIKGVTMPIMFEFE